MPKKGVFIIESLDFEDEEEDRFEGKFLSRILKLSGVPHAYYYIRTRRELEKVLEKFDDSEFRYLHLSCHGSPTSLSTTIDWIAFQDLGEMLSPYIAFKRVFISACSAVNDALAESILPKTRCYSLIGPVEDIYFNDAAIFWASFYHLLLDRDKMKYEEINEILAKLTDLYSVPMNYYKSSKTEKKRYELKKYKQAKH